MFVSTPIIVVFSKTINLITEKVGKALKNIQYMIERSNVPFFLSGLNMLFFYKYHQTSNKTELL